ncbi:hypothetical protein BpHYR1_054138 [Brachionus plicatilis]|uniref:Uncharacterized protein n=1 Tax=Brachionus plicatilis TaxID=10195 RepID=A0A3M7S8W3_BRAPC|nr:hypothetical protein BpHYR1_054138 [Brachionus plicatilis]
MPNFERIKRLMVKCGNLLINQLTTEGLTSSIRELRHKLLWKFGRPSCLHEVYVGPRDSLENKEKFVLLNRSLNVLVVFVYYVPKKLSLKNFLFYSLTPTRS